MENKKFGEMTVEEDTDGKALWFFEGKIKTDVPLETDADTVVEAINELVGKLQDGGGGDDTSIIKPWVRPSDWPALPTPANNQVVFLATTAFNPSPYMSVDIRPLDKYAFPENGGVLPAGLTGTVDWGDGHVSTGIHKPENAGTVMEWTNPFGFNGDLKDKNPRIETQPGNYYYDFTGSYSDGAEQKFWNAGGTVLTDGSRVFVVTVTVSDPQNVVIYLPTNSYALEMHIGKNINIGKTTENQTQAFLQHVKAFGWQPGNNRDKQYSYTSGGVVNWNTNGLFGGTKVLRKIDATEPFTEIPDNMFKNCMYIPEMDMSEVVSVGENAFAYTYNSGIYTFNLIKCKEIKKNAFYNIKAKFKISCPNLETLGDGAFSNCYGLAEINMPKIETVPQQCFDSCYALQKVDAPELTKIEDKGFNNCNTLTYANMPNLEYLGVNGFAYNYNLREAIFPKLTYAGNGSFANCYALEKLVCGEGTSLENAGLASSYLWYDNPDLISRRPTDIH